MLWLSVFIVVYFFFFNDTATTEIYTLSLHDALPISLRRHGDPVPHQRPVPPARGGVPVPGDPVPARRGGELLRADRKSTRLDSSHSQISYSLFCLEKKNNHALKADATDAHRVASTAD